MDWIRGYYTRKSEWLGPTGIFPEHLERAAAIEHLCGSGPKRVLELGAGAGGAAAATADRGHAVVAVELSPLRASFARDLARDRPNLEVIEADFYTVDLFHRFDVVCFWDSFGMGTDADQRRLLQRVAQEWLAEGGHMLLDVMSPWAWARKAGREERLDRIWRLVGGEVKTVDLEVPVKTRYDFDPVTCRFIDEWWPLRKRGEAISQTIRCYTPADLLLLLEGTGLRADLFEVNSVPFDVVPSAHSMGSPQATEERYLVRLILGGP